MIDEYKKKDMKLQETIKNMTGADHPPILLELLHLNIHYKVIQTTDSKSSHLKVYDLNLTTKEAVASLSVNTTALIIPLQEDRKAKKNNIQRFENRIYLW